MNLRESIIRMLKQLQVDTQVLHQQGAGYYSCTPMVRRYNKLLGQARTLFAPDDGLISTFEDAAENDPKDPSEKMKVVQAIRLESGQLITLLESTRDDDKAQGAAT